MSSARFLTSAKENPVPDFGCRIPSSSMSLENFFLSSARSIESGEVPSILVFLPLSSLWRGSAKLIAVWPPNWSTTPSASSLSMTFITSSTVMGSKYNLVEMSKSVDTVSGLLLTMTASMPSSLIARAPCTQQ